MNVEVIRKPPYLLGHAARKILRHGRRVYSEQEKSRSRTLATVKKRGGV